MVLLLVPTVAGATGTKTISAKALDVRGIIGILAEIDPRFEDLLTFHFTPDPQVQDFFLITCLWGPFGTSWSSYSQVRGYYEYSRLVLWLRVNTDPQEGSLP